MGVLATLALITLLQQGQGPSPSPTGTNAEEQPGVDFDHVFGKSVVYAQGRWIRLAQTIPLIERFGMAPDAEGLGDLEGRKAGARELVGRIGHLIASAEVQEAERARDRVPGETLAQAQDLLQEGEERWRRAVARGDDAELTRALLRFEGVLNLLLPRLHPDFNRVSPP